MICDPVMPYPFFTYDIADVNGTDYPIYRVYDDCQEPQAAFIEFNLEDEDYFFLADHCTDHHYLSKPRWDSHLIRVPISPLVSYADIDNLSMDLTFYNLVRRLYQGFIEDNGEYPCEYTESAKRAFIEIEDYLKQIKVTQVDNHLQFYKRQKSIALPFMFTGFSILPPWLCRETLGVVHETHEN